MGRVGKSYPSGSIKDRLVRAESSREILRKRVTDMFTGIVLAITYIEDGAPLTAIRVLKRTLAGRGK
jgi:hypothetical protein